MTNKEAQGVYKITNNRNGKIYIGSSVNIHNRWVEHIRHLKQNKHHSIHLQRAWNKYGEDCFKVQVLETVKDRNDLFSIEQQWLDGVQPYDRDIGYNISKQAIGVSLFGEDNGFYGREHTEETKQHLSNIRKTMYNGVDNPMYGKKHTSKTKEKISKANMGNVWSKQRKESRSKSIKGVNNPNCKKVICTTTGRVFDLIKEAGAYYNLKTFSHITSCCKGKRKSCGKLEDGTPLQWMYYEDYKK